MDSFDTVADYTAESIEYVRRTCLYLATILEDHLNDIVVVGGFVPQLLVNPASLEDPDERHVGTRDLDIGLALHLLEEERYKGISERLRGAGFRPDQNDQGRPTSQRWRIEGEGFPKVTVDFLIGQVDEEHAPGKLHNLEKDFSAFIAPAVPLAFRDRDFVLLNGKTILGEEVTREIRLPVCGPGAFIILKAIAFRKRGKFKDAYDLFWLIRNYEGDLEGVASRLRPLLDSSEGQQALKILEEDFTKDDRTGPMRVALFLRTTPDPAIQADVVAFMQRFLKLCIQDPQGAKEKAS